MSEHHEKRVKRCPGCGTICSVAGLHHDAGCGYRDKWEPFLTVPKDVAEELYDVLVLLSDECLDRPLSGPHVWRDVEEATRRYREAVGEGSEPHA